VDFSTTDHPKAEQAFAAAIRFGEGLHQALEAWSRGQVFAQADRPGAAALRQFTGRPAS
jgi:hypothetical protein